REQQVETTWINYVHEKFQDRSSASRRQRMLVLAISAQKQPVQRSTMTKLTPEIAEEYATKTSRTLIRDLHALLQMELLILSKGRYSPNMSEILAFLPTRRAQNRDDNNEVEPAVTQDGKQNDEDGERFPAATDWELS